MLIGTDAFAPQINGVVRTYERMAEELPGIGAEVTFLSPSAFRTVPCPTYPEIRLALISPGMAARTLDTLRPDYVHIATEGPIGLALRAACRRAGRRFTTSYHTRFPEYVAARFPVPLTLGWRAERWFHNGGNGTMAATPSLAAELTRQGFRTVLPWSRGVDIALFRPRPVRRFGPGPVFLSVGRVAPEKNIEAFLRLDLPGRKVVVGGGPALHSLRAGYPEVHFTGPLVGEALAEAYASADVFVFPSRTDTYGVVLLEALASGLPVAALPVTGPRDLIDRATGVLDDDLHAACLAALELGGGAARAYAERFGWRASAEQFVANLEAASRK